jgi:hypothetical protein
VGLDGGEERGAMGVRLCDYENRIYVSTNTFFTCMFFGYWMGFDYGRWVTGFGRGMVRWMIRFMVYGKDG